MLIIALGFLYISNQKYFQNEALESNASANEKNTQEQPKDTKAKPESNLKPPADSSKKAYLENITSDAQRIYFGNSLMGIKTGDCKLTVSQNGVNIKEVKGKVELVTSYYSCSGMVLAKSDLFVGTLQAVIVVTTDNEDVVSNEVSYDNK